MEQLGPYPMEKLKRVEKPTTLITDNIKRFDEREQGFNRAAWDDLGPTVQRERTRPSKYPLLAATQGMTFYLTTRVSGLDISERNEYIISIAGYSAERCHF